MNFSQVYDLNSLKYAIQQSSLPRRDVLVRKINNVNAESYPELIKVLKSLRFTSVDEYRIFRYKDGSFRFNNLSRFSPTQPYDIKAKYTNITKEMIDNYRTSFYLTDEVGIVIPVFYNGYVITFLEDSEYYMKGNKVFVTPSIYDGVQFLSNYKIDSDDINRLIKLIGPDVDYILIVDQKRLYNLRAQILYLNPLLLKEEIYVKAMQQLDLLRQPYVKGFAHDSDVIDPTLIKLIRQPEGIFWINQLKGMSFLKGNAETYRELGLNNVCHIASIVLFANANFQLVEPNIEQIQKLGTQYTSPQYLFNSILSCKYDYIVVGLGLVFPAIKHQMVLILNKKKQEGYLFDPSYTATSTKFADLYDSIIKYFKDKLNYPHMTIKSSNNFGCPYLYGFQSDINDLYCISWSFYLSLLYLLNENIEFESIVQHLYNIGPEGIKVIIPRFLIWLFGDLTDVLLELL